MQVAMRVIKYLYLYLKPTVNISGDSL